MVLRFGEEGLGFGRWGFRPGDRIGPAFGRSLLPASPSLFEQGRLLPGQVGRHPSDSPGTENALAYFYCADAYCKGKDFEPALANLAEAVRLEQKRTDSDLSFELRARDLYVEIYQSQVRTYTDARQWEKVFAIFGEIDNLKLPMRTVYGPQEAELRRQKGQAYQDQGSDCLKSQNWDGAIDSFEKAISLDNSKARQLNTSLAQAYRERGFDHANRGEFEEAACDLKKAFKLDKDNAQDYRFCGLTCGKMAKACHDRGLTADEKEQWESAIRYLKWAIWLDPELEYVLRRPLADAHRNLAMVSVPAN